MQINNLHQVRKKYAGVYKKKIKSKLHLTDVPCNYVDDIILRKMSTYTWINNELDIYVYSSYIQVSCFLKAIGSKFYLENIM